MTVTDLNQLADWLDARPTWSATETGVTDGV